ncbi:MAG: glycosyltransferase family 4 protein [Planctomycetota bacterium]|nr:glycosyltransferase family 4 protein [Planctomycetota bacterium]
MVWAQELGSHPEKALAEFDLVVYNLGDHYTYHELCFDHLERVPGIVVLHDYVLHNALNGYCHAKMNPQVTYDAVLEQECGEEAVAAMRALVHEEPSKWWQQEIVRFPVLRWALRNSTGVIVHSAFAGNHVRSRVACPIAEIPLAYDGGESSYSPQGFSSQPHEKLRLLTVGHINPNKRVQMVVEVLASNERLRKNLEYHVVGPIEDSMRSEIQSLICANGLESQVTITGRVECQQLHEEFQKADAVVCLRNPAMEGGSASVVEGLLTGKPVIVSNTGCFAEIPDAYVHKVDVQNEHLQLKRVLNSLVDAYDSAVQRAQAARTWAIARHSAAGYAQSFLEFGERVLYDRPVLRTIDRVSEYLRVARVSPPIDLLERLDVVMGGLFCDGRRAQRIAEDAGNVVSS